MRQATRHIRGGGWLICIGFLLWLVWSPTAVTAQSTETHIVQPGETLSSIALVYSTHPETLRHLNQFPLLQPLFPGQKVHLTAEAASAEAEEQNGQMLASRGLLTHVVRPGETLARIARSYSLDVQDILPFNQLENPDLIKAGWELFVPDSGVRPLVSSTPAGLPIYGGTKQVLVDISEQRTYLFDGGELIQTFIVSTGLPGQDTQPGTYAVQNKLPIGYGYTWGLQMPYWIGIYWAGPLQNGFHALPIDAYGNKLWAGYLGSPISYGCIVLGDADAETLYNWVEIGTKVVIQP